MVSLIFSDIVNFKSVVDMCMSMSCSNTKEKKVKWLKMKGDTVLETRINTLQI